MLITELFHKLPVEMLVSGLSYHNEGDHDAFEANDDKGKDDVGEFLWNDD